MNFTICLALGIRRKAHSYISDDLYVTYLGWMLAYLPQHDTLYLQINMMKGGTRFSAELWLLLMHMGQHAGIASYLNNTLSLNVPRPLVLQYVYNFKKSPTKVACAAAASNTEIDCE